MASATLPMSPLRASARGSSAAGSGGNAASASLPTSPMRRAGSAGASSGALNNSPTHATTTAPVAATQGYPGQAPAMPCMQPPPAGRLRCLIFKGNNAGLVHVALDKRPWWQVEEAPGLEQLPDVLRYALPLADYVWKPSLLMRPHMPGAPRITLHSFTYGKPKGTKLMNHFPVINTISTKTGLLKTMTDYYKAQGRDPFEVLPITFAIRSREGAPVVDNAYRHFSKVFQSIEDGNLPSYLPEKHAGANLWLLKPASLNQGRGIELFTDLATLKTLVQSAAGRRDWVVQKYMERPLLYRGRKFDIRIWALVDEAYQIWLYQDGYLRTSSEPFSLPRKGAGSADRMVHLTNYCLQSKSENVGKHEPGNTLSFGQFQTYLDEHHGGVSLRNSLYPQMCVLVVDALIAARESMTAGTVHRPFELFGFDFLVDEDMKVWLIEVNSNPFLCAQNEWHGRMLEAMMEELTQLVVDPVYPPPTEADGACIPKLTDPKFHMLYSEAKGIDVRPRSTARAVSAPAATAAAGGSGSHAPSNAANASPKTSSRRSASVDVKSRSRRTSSAVPETKDDDDSGNGGDNGDDGEADSTPTEVKVFRGVCRFCGKTGHEPVHTAPNGDKSASCPVAFAYDWTDFPVFEIVSDTGGEGLPPSWVEWFFHNRARGVDIRLMLCMLAQHKYRPRFLIQSTGKLKSHRRAATASSSVPSQVGSAPTTPGLGSARKRPETQSGKPANTAPLAVTGVVSPVRPVSSAAPRTGVSGRVAPRTFKFPSPRGRAAIV